MNELHVHRAERLWMTLGIGMLVAAFIILMGWAALAEGIIPPCRVESIDPTKVAPDVPPLRQAVGLRKLPDGTYEAYYVARVFSFTAPALGRPARRPRDLLRYERGRRARLHDPGNEHQHDGYAGMGQHRRVYLSAAREVLADL